MKLAKAVLTETGVVLLNARAILTDSLIQTLSKRGISEVVVEQEKPSTVEDALTAERQRFIDVRNQMITAVAEVFQDISRLQPLPVTKLENLADSLLLPLLERSNIIFPYLHIMDNRGEYLFRHSVNVAVLSGILGAWLKWPQEDLRDLVLAGLLHDVGKVSIPSPILDKPGKLLSYEMEIMKFHAQLGFDLVKDCNQLSPAVKEGVWQHHERIDGTGYPQKLVAEAISPIGKVIAVADVYDAMVSRRVYREPLSPLVVMKEIYQAMFSSLDAKICLTFLEQAAKSLIGSCVRLSNGLLGKLVYMNYGSLNPLIVQLDSGECLCLEQCNLKIAEIVV